MEEKNYKVYMHIFPNNKKYIGITKQTPEKRWENGKGYKHNNYIQNAINKYGWKNIKHKILYKDLTKEQAEEKEIKLIAYYKSNKKEYGYNIEKGKIISKETRQKMSENNAKIWLGKKINDEIREKMSESHKGKQGNNKGKALKTRKKVICVETNTIYNSITIASNITKVNSAHISEACRGIRKSAGKINNKKLHWKYIEEE